MNSRLRNYLSVFSPQFVRGIGVLAAEAQFERRKFLDSVKLLPNFFEVAKHSVKNKKLARRVRLAVWSAISIAWVLAIMALAFLRLGLVEVVAVVLVACLFAPYVILRIAAWCLPKAGRASR